MVREGLIHLREAKKTELLNVCLKALFRSWHRARTQTVDGNANYHDLNLMNCVHVLSYHSVPHKYVHLKIILKENKNRSFAKLGKQKIIV
jgi:hypothetical protein